MLVENDEFPTSGVVLPPQEPILVLAHLKVASFWQVRTGESLVGGWVSSLIPASQTRQSIPSSAM